MADSSFLCGISKGIKLDCSGKGQLGGLNRRLFLGNIKNLANAAYTTDADGYITDINFDAYGFLYEFIGQKYSHSATDNVARNEGGSVNYPHSVTLKISDVTPDDKAVIEDLTASDVFAVVVDNNQQIRIYGAFNGLTIDTAEQNTGNNAESDTTRTVVLSGNETGLAKVFLDTDYNTSIAKIESYVG